MARHSFWFVFTLDPVLDTAGYTNFTDPTTSKAIMQLLRDNLTLWTSDMQNPGSSLGVSGGSVGRIRSFGDATSYKGGYNPTQAYLIGVVRV